MSHIGAMQFTAHKPGPHEFAGSEKWVFCVLVYQHEVVEMSPTPASRSGLARGLRRLPVCLLFALSACGGGGGSTGRIDAPPAAAVTPPADVLPRGITVLAGVTGGFGDADGPLGRLQSPSALAVGGDGALYIGSFGGAVRKAVAGTGVEMVLSTLWKGREAPRALVLDAAGNLVGILGTRIVRIAPDGTLATLAGSDEPGLADGAGAEARFSSPEALAIDAAGLVYVVDTYRIRTVNAAGEVRTHEAATRALSDVVGELYGQPMYVTRAPVGLAFDRDGNLVIAVSGYPVRKVTPAGVRVDTALAANTAVAADREGRLYGFSDCTLYRLDTSGQPGVLAGSSARRGPVDGAGGEASFGTANGCDARIAVDSAGNVYVTDAYNDSVRKVTANGVVSTVAGKAAVAGLQDGAGAAARFDFGARDLSFDGKDSLYLVQESKVRKVTRAGAVTTLNLPEKDAGGNPITYFTGGMAYGGSIVGYANRVVYLVDENGGMRALAGSAGAAHRMDGAGAQAGFGILRGVARDGAGNFYLLDGYDLFSAPTDVFPESSLNRIRKVTPGGVVTTLYAPESSDTMRQPWHIVADRQGNVYGSTNSHSVLRITPAGSATSLAVDLEYSGLLSVDEGGTLYLAGGDLQPFVVERLDALGQARLIAGRRDQYGLIPGALPGSLNRMGGMTVDERGVIYVLTENAVVRIVP